MLNNENFYNTLKQAGVDFFTGVPDSLLESFLAYLYDNLDNKSHIIAANEGNSIALASGYHLATGKTALVYMQNSGIGNAINPLTSLTDEEVYSIPMILMIGWRGEPGVKDEPQHVKQGKITLDLLKVLGIPYAILPTDQDKAEQTIKGALAYANTNLVPYAIVVQKNTFEEYKSKKSGSCSHQYELSRENAIKIVVDNLDNKDIVVSTTGKTSRELFEYREVLKQGHTNDFLTVGSMGHCSQIATAIALSKNDRKIYCMDGDGATIMHMGALAIIGTIQPNNLIHIILNNGAHCSVGGQATCAFEINITGIAKACGYKYAKNVTTADELKETLKDIRLKTGPHLIEIRLKTGSRKDLGRPTTTPIENKNAFMRFLKDK